MPKFGVIGSSMNENGFADRVLTWFDVHGRKGLPWQSEKSPYRVWISETMLQQTQVATVIPYFNAFLARFPSIADLAQADIDDVMQHWSGLGYYARARNLHRAAEIIHHQGSFPDSFEAWLQLPGVGRSTAGAIMSIAFEEGHPILDGNVKRVLARYRAVAGWPGDAVVAARLWELSRSLLPKRRVADYTQAIMDIGATLCTRRKPKCEDCPLSGDCLAHLSGRVADFPASKTVKALSVKQVTLLLMINEENQIFLEKRPPVGIWGGLWCLPEFEDNNRALLWCKESGFCVQQLDLMTMRRHTFSHFHLDFTTLIVSVGKAALGVSEPLNDKWHRLEGIDQKGLPAPIKNLLCNIKNREDCNGKND